MPNDDDDAARLTPAAAAAAPSNVSASAGAAVDVTSLSASSIQVVATCAVNTPSIGSKRKSSSAAAVAAASSLRPPHRCQTMRSNKQQHLLLHPPVHPPLLPPRPPLVRSARAAAATASCSSPAASSPQSDDAEKQSPAASASSSSTSNPHLASVLESASASAPVAKRTRRAAQSAREAAGRILASPMLRLMGRDSGARQSLMTMLTVEDLVSLLRSSRSWCAWSTEEPASVGGQHVTIRGRWISFLECDIRYRGPLMDSFERCRWIHRTVQSLCFGSSRASAAQIGRFLRWLPRFSRLRSLSLGLGACAIRRHVPLFRLGLSAVCSTLTDLDIFLHTNVGQETMLAGWDAVRVLAGLVSLSVKLDTSDVDLDFSFLPSMLRLKRLEVRCSGFNRVRSAEQVEALAQCKALTDLNCGVWLPPTTLMDRVDPDSLTQRALIQRHFALLIRRRKENAAASLRGLRLNDQLVIDPDGWRLLSQCTELEQIEASWSSTLAEADWARLANFQQLHTIFITGRCVVDGRIQTVGPLSELSHVLPPLLHCRALRSLIFDGTFRLRAEHAALLARIPSLQALVCRSVRIESLAALSAAPAHEALTFPLHWNQR